MVAVVWAVVVGRSENFKSYLPSSTIIDWGRTRVTTGPTEDGRSIRSASAAQSRLIGRSKIGTCIRTTVDMGAMDGGGTLRIEQR